MYLSQVQYRKAIYGIISIMNDVQRTDFYSGGGTIKQLNITNGLW